MTLRETSPTRRLAVIEADRNSAKASCSLSCRRLIKTPLARSSHLRSSRRASASPSAAAWACSCVKRGKASSNAACTPRAAAAASVGASGSQAITRAASQLAGSAGGRAGPSNNTGSGKLPASRASAACSRSACPSSIATTACGARRTASRTNMWQGSSASTGWPDKRKASASAGAWSCMAGPSAATISRVMAGRQAAMGRSGPHHTAPALPTPPGPGTNAATQQSLGVTPHPRPPRAEIAARGPAGKPTLPGPLSWPAFLARQAAAPPHPALQTPPAAWPAGAIGSANPPPSESSP